jgi:hypothetical protein
MCISLSRRAGVVNALIGLIRLKRTEKLERRQSCAAAAKNGYCTRGPEPYWLHHGLPGDGKSLGTPAAGAAQWPPAGAQGDL